MEQIIVDLLMSKEHNPHYLNRYIKFIDSCKQNNTLSSGEFEVHHILPKSRGWFIEYKDLRKHPWNAIKLSYRQHFIAHVLLWKSFGKDQFLPVYLMTFGKASLCERKKDFLHSIKSNSKLYQKSKEVYYEWVKGRKSYKDSNGVKYYIKPCDPIISKLKLKRNRPLKDKMRYTDKNGIFQGWYKKDDPFIEENAWIPQWTENNARQLAERTKKAIQANTGTTIYNNGNVEIKRREHPGEGWLEGRLERSDTHLKNQAAALRKVRVGKEVWNDGEKNFYIVPGTPTESHWIKGMRPRQKKPAIMLAFSLC